MANDWHSPRPVGMDFLSFLKFGQQSRKTYCSSVSPQSSSIALYNAPKHWC
jgi:hypothetical protein